MADKKGKAYWTTYYILTFIMILIISYGGWRLQRYLKWKFGYKAKVEQRIELIEKRVEELENR